MAIVTLDQIKRKVRWNNVISRSGVHTCRGREFPFHVFEILPDEKRSPSIDLHFDAAVTIVDTVSFGRWHAHCDTWSDERRKVVVALRIARGLIEGKLCLVEELGGNGKSLGSSLQPPAGIPDTLGKDVQYFRRTLFNGAPEFEEIDFDRYFEGEHLLVEWDAKRRAEQVFQTHGMPPVEW